MKTYLLKALYFCDFNKLNTMIICCIDEVSQLAASNHVVFGVYMSISIYWMDDSCSFVVIKIVTVTPDFLSDENIRIYRK